MQEHIRKIKQQAGSHANFGKGSGSNMDIIKEFEAYLKNKEDNRPTCFICKKKGHKASECHAKQRHQRFPHYMAEEEKRKKNKQVKFDGMLNAAATPTPQQQQNMQDIKDVMFQF